jgi:hypothetical protein
MKGWVRVFAVVCPILFLIVNDMNAQVTATPNPNCTLIVPAGALSAAGLSTPYQLVATDPNAGDCHEANVDQSAFVQAAIIDPATGQISVYNPLVVDQGATPAMAPVIPTLPANAVVAIWFGYNGNVLTLQGAQSDTLSAASCVNGLRGSNFGQFAYCNAPAFFRAAHRALRSRQITIPPLGTAADGQPCPTVRDFFVVDQDQSDNLPISYLVVTDTSNNSSMAQRTQANLAAFPSATVLGNPSDNRLVDVALDGALGCSPWKVPDLADPGQMGPALPLNELQARAFQRAPIALVPLGDPMTLDNNGKPSMAKVNAYRRGVDQPMAWWADQASTARYCRHMLRIAPARMMADQAMLMPDATHPTRGLSPDPAVADSLFTFLGQRFVASYEILGCSSILNLADPVSVTADSQGVTTSVTVDTSALKAYFRSFSPYQPRDDAADSAAAQAAACTE